MPFAANSSKKQEKKKNVKSHFIEDYESVIIAHYKCTGYLDNVPTGWTGGIGAYCKKRISTTYKCIGHLDSITPGVVTR